MRLSCWGKQLASSRLALASATVSVMLSNVIAIKKGRGGELRFSDEVAALESKNSN